MKIWAFQLIIKFSHHLFRCLFPYLLGFTKLSIGGVPLPGKPGTFLRKNFQGCVENMYYNGVNIIDLAKRRKPQIYSVVSGINPSSCGVETSALSDMRMNSAAVETVIHRKILKS